MRILRPLCLAAAVAALLPVASFAGTEACALEDGADDLQLGEMLVHAAVDRAVHRVVVQAAHAAQCLRHLEHHVLAIADHEEVHERRQRLRVEDGGAAGERQRMRVGAIRGSKRHTGEIEDVQDVRVRELGLKREAEDQARSMAA